MWSVENDQQLRIQSENIVTEIIFEKEDLEKLEPVKYMKLVAAFATTDNGQVPVKIYSFYTLDFSLGVSVGFTVNSRD